MRKIKNYIARSVLSAIAMVLLVIVALDGISEFINELDDIEGNYGLMEILIYTALSVPGNVYEYLPLACLVGCLVGLGMLASSSELVVMRAAGVSVAQVVWAAMRPVCIYIVFSIFLGEYVTPVAYQYSESRKAIALGHESALEGQRGVWNREGREFMHFSAVLPNGQLFGVTRLQFDEGGQLTSSTYVDTAIYQGGLWVLKDGVTSFLGEDEVRQETFSLRTWHTDISPELLDVLVLRPEELPIQRLHTYTNYLERQGQDAGEYLLAFWQKALQPLAIASLVMIAISFVFGPLRSVTMGFRIFTGVMVGIVFRTTQDLLGPSSLIFGFPPLLAVLLPVVGCLVVGLLLLRRSN